MTVLTLQQATQETSYINTRQLTSLYSHHRTAFHRNKVERLK